MKETNKNSIHYDLQEASSWAGRVKSSHRLQASDVGREISEFWGFGAVQLRDVGAQVTLDQNGVIWLSHRIEARP